MSNEYVHLKYWMFRKLLSLKYGIKVSEVTQEIVDKYNEDWRKLSER